MATQNAIMAAAAAGGTKELQKAAAKEYGRVAETARTHQSAAASGGASVQFRSRVGDANTVVETADNLLTILADRKKRFALLFLIALVTFLVWKFRDNIKSAVQSVWHTVTDPITNTVRQANADAKGNEEANKKSGYYSIDGTTESAEIELTSQQAKQIAETILGSFNAWWKGDDEQKIYAVLHQIPGPRSWVKVCSQYEALDGQVAGGIWGQKTASSTLAADLRSKLTKSEYAKCREILQQNNINDLPE